MKGWSLLLAGTTVFSIAMAKGPQSGSPKPPPSARTQAQRVSYAGDVTPILRAHCVSCHTGASAAAGLDLSTPKFAGRRSLILPGKPQASEFLRRVKGLGGKNQMPLGFKPLSPEKIEVISSWIAQGARIDHKVETHWSYVPPVRPGIPAIASKWISNPIDAFVLEQMLKRGLQPAVRAKKETLLRRLKLDLVGLPPTLEELDAFIKDESPEAYERMVDKFLALPAYGERQARIWLDLARYADTNGYEADRNRTAWPYRDWVIQAFNQNMPYDQFSIEQLAGDMLPGATAEQRIASGFHRNSMFNEEGGIDPAEARYAMVIDRVSTTSMVWLGSTLQCARCHDHKFDPFSQKDFYKLYAIFGNTDYEVRGRRIEGQERWYEPTIPYLSAEHKAKIAEAESHQKAAEAVVAQVFAQNRSALERIAQRAAAPVSWTPARIAAASAKSATLSVEESRWVLVSGTKAATDTFRIEGKLAPGARAIKLDAEVLNGAVGRASSKNFLLTSIKLTVGGKPAKFTQAAADFVQNGYNLDELLKGNRDSGWAVAPYGDKPHALILEMDEPAPGQDAQGEDFVLELGFDSPWPEHTFSKFSVSASDEVWASRLFAPAEVIADAINTDRSAGQTARLYTMLGMNLPEVRPALEGLRVAKSTLRSIHSAVPQAMVLKEKPADKVLTAPLYHRGEFVSPGQPVPAGVPSVMPAIKAPAVNRLSFARWLFTPNHPLTARVQVNRIWEQYFGRGIVPTVDDFGTQGEKPSHPKLLDWLATEFVRTGWDMKALHKLIVMSNTYKQSSRFESSKYRADPTNTWLARGPRYRLEAETIRDASLHASGLLVEKVGGPSVMPFQPNGVWDSPYSGERWMTASNEDRFRRGLYVFWKRSSSYPSFIAFDATSRETCTTTRIRTNTPLQALALMNDQAYIEMAQALAKQMMAARGDTHAKLTHGFRRVTSRFPTPGELTTLSRSLSSFLEKYQKDPASAAKIGSSPDHAAWTLIGNILLNLDEAITKE